MSRYNKPAASQLAIATSLQCVFPLSYMNVCGHLYYIEDCGLLLAIKFTQLPHKGVVKEVNNW